MKAHTFGNDHKQVEYAFEPKFESSWIFCSEKAWKQKYSVLQKGPRQRMLP